MDLLGPLSCWKTFLQVSFMSSAPSILTSTQQDTFSTILCFCFFFQSDVERCWCLTPGGSLNRKPTHQQTIQRHRTNSHAPAHSYLRAFQSAQSTLQCLDCGRKPEYLQIFHASTLRTSLWEAPVLLTAAHNLLIAVFLNFK